MPQKHPSTVSVNGCIKNRWQRLINISNVWNIHTYFMCPVFLFSYLFYINLHDMKHKWRVKSLARWATTELLDINIWESLLYLYLYTWSDESHFLLWNSDDGVKIWCKHNESRDPPCLLSTVQSSGGITVWWIFSKFGSLSTSWVKLKLHNLPEYSCWSCPSLHDHRWLLPAG